MKAFECAIRLVITFLPRSKPLLISWLQSPSAVILEPKKIKSVSIVPPSVCHEVMGPDDVSAKMEQKLYRGDTVLAEIEITLVFLSLATMRPTKIPEEIIKLME